jgi:hypothetical protein
MWPYGVKKQQQATTTTTTTSEQAQEKRWRSFLRKDVCLAESKSFETCMETFPPTRDQGTIFTRTSSLNFTERKDLAEGRWRIANPCRPLAAEIPRCVGYYYCKPQIAYVEAECKINPVRGRLSREPYFGHSVNMFVLLSHANLVREKGVILLFNNWVIA